MNDKSFFSGLEELVARIVSLVFSVLFFAVYSYATGVVSINWQSMVSYLLIFWLIYECLAYLLYIIFKFFGDGPKTGAGLTIPVDDIETHLPANKNLQTEGTAE